MGSAQQYLDFGTGTDKVVKTFQKFDRYATATDYLSLVVSHSHPALSMHTENPSSGKIFLAGEKSRSPPV